MEKKMKLKVFENGQWREDIYTFEQFQNVYRWPAIVRDNIKEQLKIKNEFWIGTYIKVIRE
jgi:hypothetical protein